MSAAPTTDGTDGTDLSPAAERRLQTDVDERTWLLRPLFLRLDALEAKMASEFTDLQAAVHGIGGEGGELEAAAQRVIAAVNAKIDTLNGIVTNLQQQVTDAQTALAQANADLAAGRQVAAESTATLTAAKAGLDQGEQELSDLAASLETQPAPAPAPEPTPAP